MGRRLSASAPPSAPASSATVTTQAPDPECWSLARLYANGDVRRLRVLDPATVLVLNNPA